MLEMTPSVGITTLSRLYGFAGSAALFAVGHIETLKHADSALANRCGLVLEAVVQGFGVGSETALVLIGVGQSLLGNPLIGGTVAVGSANPIVLTCAAVGAIHYGWNALNDGERDAVLANVGRAFDVGIELVRSVATLAMSTIRAIMSAENYTELKRMVVATAAAFEKSFSDITGALRDRLAELSQALVNRASTVRSTVAARLPNPFSGVSPES